ncbi:hypothetical protein ANO11243_046920 [Dothideomycetidae sp. 11243]|nr:hypothetical protein ANO11243_046920 [fungal sp. No.11243]
MAKDKSAKKAAAKVAAVPAANGVKSGRVTKTAEKPNVKSKEVAKTVAKAHAKEEEKRKKSKKEPESESEATSDSSDSSDNDSDSDSESEVETKAAPKANGVKKVSKAAKAEESSDDSSSEDDSSEDESAPKVKAASSSDDVDMAESDADSSDEDSDSSSDEKPAAAAAKGDSDSDSDATSDDESDEVEAPAKKIEEPVKKRKAEADPVTPGKRVKMNGDPVGEPSKQLFVGSLSWNVDEDWLAREFEGFGEIVGVRIITRPEDGKSKGFGYVEFSSEEDATKALDAKQGALVDGREINVDFGKPRPDRSYNNEQVSARAQKFGDRAPNAPSNTLFVGNVSFNATQDMLSEAFAEYGSVNSIRLPTDQETGTMKGFGYVEFGSIEEAQGAKDALNGADIGGRNIRLDFAGPRPSNDSNGFGGGRGGGRGRGGFGGRGGGRGGARGGRGGPRGGGRGGRGGFSSTNRGGFGDFQGKKVTF